MAQGVRTQVADGARIRGRAARGIPERGTPKRRIAPQRIVYLRIVYLRIVYLGALLAWTFVLSACGPPPSPLDPTTVVAAVLDHCHGPLQGQMDRVHLELAGSDGEAVEAHVDLPNALRANDSSGRFLAVGETCHVLGEESRPATATETERLLALRALVDAAALGPLYRATGCERLGDREFRLTQPAGDPITLRVADDDLVPVQIGETTFDEHLHTPVARIAKSVRHARLGAFELHFVDYGVTRRPGFFTLRPGPSGKPPPADGSDTNGNGGQSAGPRIRFPTAATGGRPTTPKLAPAKTANWLLLDDPGTWQARHDLYTPLHDRLIASGQRIGGFPILTTIDERTRLAIPYRARRRGAVADIPTGAEVRAFAAGREVEVYPPVGDLETRRTLGAAALEAFLARERLEAIGPIACQPFVHLHEGPPNEQKLATLVVRMSVRVR
ncbi:MAG: hypothetical protein NXI31_09295 [bacterium]|nr:hypothetical protein [bacterium]